MIVPPLFDRVDHLKDAGLGLMLLVKEQRMRAVAPGPVDAVRDAPGVHLLYAAGAARVVKFLPAPALPLDAVVKDGVIELRDIHLAPQAVELLHVALERIKPRIINCRVPIKMRLEPHGVHA